jgi:hypothetical protein
MPLLPYIVGVWVELKESSVGVLSSNNNDERKEEDRKGTEARRKMSVTCVCLVMVVGLFRVLYYASSLIGISANPFIDAWHCPTRNPSLCITQSFIYTYIHTHTHMCIHHW